MTSPPFLANEALPDGTDRRSLPPAPRDTRRDAEAAVLSWGSTSTDRIVAVMSLGGGGMLLQDSLTLSLAISVSEVLFNTRY